MKQLESRTIVVGDNTFYVRPFAAFTAANVLGQLTKIVTPIIGGLLPIVSGVGTKDESGNEKRLFDIDVKEAASAIAEAVSSISGDKLEMLLRQLLITHQNVSFDDPNTGKTVRLTEELANEVFCGDTQDMFILAFEVAKLNFSGFFEKLASQFGSAFAPPMNQAAASMTSMGA